MDVSLLVEVHQFYIHSLQKKLQEAEKKLPIIAPSVLNVNVSSSVPAKTVTLEIAQVSCIHGNVDIYDSSGTIVTHLAKTSTTPGHPVKLHYAFPNQIHVQKIVIKRPLCTGMVNSTVKLVDCNNTCRYESTPITEAESMLTTYTYTMPQPRPTVT